MPGFGTVVTGTVLSGSAELESELELIPGGRRVRVRGMQVHGKPARRASAGQRAAINLAGVDVGETGRGSVAVRPGCFRETKAADCILELLDYARPLKNRAPVHFHAGTAETVAEVRALDGSAMLEAGSSTPVRLVFRNPVLLVPGDRFIVRMFSPVTTIGGGEIVDPFPAPGLRLAKALDRTRALAGASLPDRIRLLVAGTPTGLSQAELVIRTGATEEALDKAVPAGVSVLRESTVWFVDTAKARALAAAWTKQVSEFHRTNPLLPGVPREDFRSRNAGGLPGFVFDFVLRQESALKLTGEHLHLSTHKLALKEDEERALALMEGAFASAGLSVPAVDEVLASTGLDRQRARSILQVLLREKRLLRVGEDLGFHARAIEALRALLSSREGCRFGVAEFKEWTGVSRKYAIPLLEFLDRERVTRRDGDLRLIIQKTSS
jgi:selenocysteine-specific elongation factor